MWELGRSLIRPFKCILDTLMQPFYIYDWARGCLGSAIAVLIKRKVHIRKLSSKKEGNAQRPGHTPKGT